MEEDSGGGAHSLDSSTILTSTKCPSRLMNSCAKVTSVETLASSFSESHRTPASELWMPLYKSSAQRPCGGGNAE